MALARYNSPHVAGLAAPGVLEKTRSYIYLSPNPTTDGQIAFYKPPELKPAQRWRERFLS